MNEAQRQQALLVALAAADPAPATLALREAGERAARGLEAYRANAAALADRALAVVFPTVRTLVGEKDFKHLARGFWLADPPARGDLGEWGDAFPRWLEAHGQIANWPYLGDCARLDLALHRNERAADAVFDAASLGLLATTDPAQLRMALMPATVLLRSAWPIASIHAAHRLEGIQAERAFDAVRAALAAARGEQVLVVRQGWRAVVHRLDPVRAGWTRSLLDGVSLGAALDRAGEGFDFAAWLATALRESWVKGVVAAND